MSRVLALFCCCKTHIAFLHLNRWIKFQSKAQYHQMIDYMDWYKNAISHWPTIDHHFKRAQPKLHTQTTCHFGQHPDEKSRWNGFNSCRNHTAVTMIKRAGTCNAHLRISSVIYEWEYWTILVPQRKTIQTIPDLVFSHNFMSLRNTKNIWVKYMTNIYCDE